MAISVEIVRIAVQEYEAFLENRRLIDRFSGYFDIEQTLATMSRPSQRAVQSLSSTWTREHLVCCRTLSFRYNQAVGLPVVPYSTYHVARPRIYQDCYLSLLFRTAL